MMCYFILCYNQDFSKYIHDYFGSFFWSVNTEGAPGSLEPVWDSETSAWLSTGSHSAFQIEINE